MARVPRLLLIAALALTAPGSGPYRAFASSVPSGSSPAPKPSVQALPGASAAVQSPLSPLQAGIPASLAGAAAPDALPTAGIARSPTATFPLAPVPAAVDLEAVPSAGPVQPASELAPVSAAENSTQYRELSPLQTPADPRSQASAPSAALFSNPALATLHASADGNASPEALREAGAGAMDPILNTRSVETSSRPRRAEVYTKARELGPARLAAGLDPEHFVVGGIKERVDPLSVPQALQEEPEPASSLQATAPSWAQVYPEKERNRIYWRFLLGQAFLSLGNGFNNTALTGLINTKAPNSGNEIADSRALNWFSQGLSSIFNGPIVDRLSIRSVMFTTYLGMALALFFVPGSFFSGYFALKGFMAVIFFLGFLQNTGSTAAAVAFARIQGEYKASYHRANAIYNITVDSMGMIGPLLAGIFIGWLNAWLGEGSGNALSYGVSALLALVAAASLWYWRPPRDELLRARRQLAETLKSDPGLAPRLRGVASEVVDARPVLVVQVSGDPEDALDIPSEFNGYAVKVAAAPRLIREMIEGFQLNRKNRFLFWSLILGSLEIMSGDALTFVALRQYMEIQGFAWAFGLYLATSALGMTISSLAMLFRTSSSPRLPGFIQNLIDAALWFTRKADFFGRLDTLEKQALVTSVLYGLGSLAYAGVFFMPALWSSLAMMLLSALLQAPAQVVWASVHQKVLQEQYPEHAAKVISARAIYQVFCQVAGLLVFGWVVSVMPAMTLGLAAGILGAVALIHMIEPFIVFPLQRRAAQ